MQSLIKFQWNFSQNRKNNCKICMEPQKIPNSQRNPEEGKIKVETSHFLLTSNYIVKLK